MRILGFFSSLTIILTLVDGSFFGIKELPYFSLFWELHPFVFSPFMHILLGALLIGLSFKLDISKMNLQSSLELKWFSLNNQDKDLIIAYSFGAFMTIYLVQFYDSVNFFSYFSQMIMLFFIFGIFLALTNSVKRCAWCNGNELNLDFLSINKDDIYYTWEFMNKDGSPDKRRSKNYHTMYFSRNALCNLCNAETEFWYSYSSRPIIESRSWKTMFFRDFPDDNETKVEGKFVNIYRRKLLKDGTGKRFGFDSSW